MVSCQHCGEDVPHEPELAVEEGRLDEAVQHIQASDDEFVSWTTSYYCDLECATAALEDGGDD